MTIIVMIQHKRLESTSRCPTWSKTYNVFAGSPENTLLFSKIMYVPKQYYLSK